MSVPRVSVCIPTYNRAGLLDTCLRSMLEQTHPSFEIVIGDNCSTDDTRAVVSRFNDDRIRYYRHDSNIGPFRNMNRVLELARGDYVNIAHDDDLYSPEFLRRESDLLEQHPNVAMVHCAVREIDADGATRRVIRAYPSTTVREGKEEFTRYLAGHNVCCSTVMARRELLLQTGGFDLRYLCADWFMWVKLALLGDVAYVAEPLASMRVHSGAVTNSLEPDTWYGDFVGILEDGFALGAESHPDLKPRRAELFRVAARAQGRRFLIEALAAISRGDHKSARGYTRMLGRFESFGLSPLYARTAKALHSGLGRRFLAAVARVRRANARRSAVAHG